MVQRKRRGGGFVKNVRGAAEATVNYLEGLTGFDLDRDGDVGVAGAGNGPGAPARAATRPRSNISPPAGARWL